MEYLLAALGVGALIYRGHLEGPLLRQAAHGGKLLVDVLEVTNCMIPFEGDHVVGAAQHVARAPVIVPCDVEALHYGSHHRICGQGTHVEKLSEMFYSLLDEAVQHKNIIPTYILLPTLIKLLATSIGCFILELVEVAASGLLL